MYKRIFWIFISCFSIVVALDGCRKETLLTDSSAKLAFTSDTILFDTVFTTVGSVTKHFKILNTHNQPLNISNISLAGGTNSNFRINVDGLSGVDFENIEIPAKDSLFVFAEVTVDPVGVNTPLIVEDSILFYTNGNEQKVWLHAWGQDAYFHNREIITANITWTNDKPHVIYGYAIVDSCQTLTIDPGTTVYGHNNSTLYMYKSSLQAVGTPGNEITFRGDRLAPFLLANPDSVAGQWRGVWFFEAKESRIEHAEIKNAVVGVQVDTLQTGQFVNLNKVRVNNSLYAGIIGQGNVRATNCLFGNSGNYSGLISYGGDQLYQYCTFGNFWNDSDRSTTLFALTDYFVTGGVIYYRPFTQATFENCIFYGPSGNDNEITLDTLDRSLGGAAPVFFFDHCLFRTDKNITDGAYYNLCKKNLNPNFADPELWDFHIGSGGAENMGKIIPGVLDDLDGIGRSIPSDVGCYEIP